MLEGILSQLPVNVGKLEKSEEFKRLITSVMNNAAKAMNNPDDALGLSLNALFVQLSESDSILMNEAEFTFMERGLITPVVSKAYAKMKG